MRHFFRWFQGPAQELLLRLSGDWPTNISTTPKTRPLETLGFLAGARGLLLLILLILLPGIGKGQDDSANCIRNGAHNATVILPDTLSIGSATGVLPDTLSIGSATGNSDPFPSSRIDSMVARVVVHSAEGVCVGTTQWKGSGSMAIAVAGRDEFVTGGLEQGELLQYRIRKRTGDALKMMVSYVGCDELAARVRPLCKGRGVYEDNVIYVLRSMTISPTQGKSSGGNLNAETPPLVQGLKATYESGAVYLEWQATVETRDAVFEVQRKRPGTGQWSRVDTLAGTPSSPDSSSHRFADMDLPYEADRLSYRLRVIKTDGANSYSREVTVRRRARDVKLLSTFPNPVRHRAILRYAVPGRQNVTIVLYDALGRQVETVVDGMKEGHQEKKLDMSGLPSGRYFLRLRAKGEVRVERLTVVR